MSGDHHDLHQNFSDADWADKDHKQPLGGRGVELIRI